MTPPTYDFYTRLAQAINSGQSRSFLLYGNVDDLFFINDGQGPACHVPLVQFLTRKWSGVNSFIQVVSELNGPLNFIKPRNVNIDPKEYLRGAWSTWKRGMDPSISKTFSDQEFDNNVLQSSNQPAFALEFLRQLCMAIRYYRHHNPQNPYHLLIIIESAEMAVPAGNGDISQLQAIDRRKIAVLEDWFSDPQFYEGSDSIVLISQSRSLIHPRIVKMPQLTEVEIKSPDFSQRRFFIEWYGCDIAEKSEGQTGPPWNLDAVAKKTAGLTLLALRQLLIESAYLYPDQDVPSSLILNQVEDFMKTQLGEEVVEFKRPSHTLDDVVGFTDLKAFIREKLITRIKKGGKGALSAIGVAGPIGGGKTFIFEAMASEMDVPVIVLKSIRSKWFGETDAIFEALRRVLEAIGQCLIFVDEADTQFGGVGSETHETERRLTGKIQAMMSDPKLKGQIVWLLMTARIQQLSPDMRRQGRAGDLIIPVLDPDFNASQDDDFQSDFYQFVRWVVAAVFPGYSDELDQDKKTVLRSIGEKLQGRSAASFAMIRSLAISEGVKTQEELEALIEDILEPDIKKVRRYQELQALLNCTRLSLLPALADTPVEAQRDAWRKEILTLEAEGYR